MSTRTPNAIMADEKHNISPPTEEESVTNTAVVLENPSENPYFRAFDANDAEWHKAFEKKLMRKVDLRLIPLMIIMCAHFLLHLSVYTPLTNAQVSQQLHRSSFVGPSSSRLA
jgi:hypothetical protein